MSNIMPDRPGARAEVSVVFTGDDLGTPCEAPSGAILFANGDVQLRFESLDVLDDVIGQLTVARFRVVQDRMAADAARRSSAPKAVAV